MIEGFGQELPEPEMARRDHGGAPPQPGDDRPAARAARRGRAAAAGSRSEVPVDPLAQTIYEQVSATSCGGEADRGLKADRKAAVKELAGPCRCRAEPAEGGERRDRCSRSRPPSTRVEERVVRELILDGTRPDGRGPKDLRPISCEVGVLPRAHGSAIFQRGETQALVTTVLGTTGDEQRVDGIMEEYTQEVHARLQHADASPSARSARSAAPAAARSATAPWPSGRSRPSCPSASEFPYTIRVRQRHPRVERLELDGQRLRRRRSA